MKKSSIIKILVSIGLVIITVIGFSIWQNNSISITNFEYTNAKIPNSFDGFTIAQISDLHNQSFGENQVKLLEKLKQLAPDMIVITGDIIDYRKYDLTNAMILISAAVEIAPVYYVSGNHEAWSNKYSSIKDKLFYAGVIVLDNESVELTMGDSSILVLGLSDPDFAAFDYLDSSPITVEKQLLEWSSNSQFKVLLSHRPELFKLYSQNNMDLIFSGHAHGGQIRIPLLGGLIAPDQGLFPKYTSGSYKKNTSTMFVSRGLGNSIFPIRIFNPPEMVVVTLKTK